jgi:hypothetical protein
MYPPHDNWENIISIAERVDENTLNVLTQRRVFLVILLLMWQVQFVINFDLFRHYATNRKVVGSRLNEVNF